MSVEPLEDAAGIYERAAVELETAARHCRTAAQHFRGREVPRATAHAWAAFGHLRTAEELMEEQARTHAQESTPL